MEIWTLIKWYEELYQVSNTWHIKAISTSKRCKERILKPWKKKSWHRFVNLCKRWIARSISVHRLVWQAYFWIDINDPKVCILHDDDDPSNNHVDNLFIGTQEDNMKDMLSKWRNRNKVFRWEKHWSTKLTDSEVIEIRKKYKWEYWEQTRLAKEYNTTLFSINRIVLGKSWKHIL